MEQYELTADLIRKIRREVAEGDNELPFHPPSQELFSIKHFADLAGVRPRTVSGWESGVSSPKPTQRERILRLAISIQQERTRRRDEIRV